MLLPCVGVGVVQTLFKILTLVIDHHKRVLDRFVSFNMSFYGNCIFYGLGIFFVSFVMERC